jgi:hypothetical protein
VWQPILAAGGLSGRRAGWKARLQARLPATRKAKAEQQAGVRAPRKRIHHAEPKGPII